MKSRWCAVFFVWACSGVFGQTASQAPIASNPIAQIRGHVAKVHIQRGAGAPALEVNTGSSVILVRLGSIRYLMEQNFNPKSGQEVVIKGYRIGDEIVAITVRTPADHREIRLRDENGWPVWSAGCCGGRR